MLEAGLGRPGRVLCFCAVFAAFAGTYSGVSALDDVSIAIAGEDEALKDALQAASRVKTAVDDGRREPRQILSAALADYRSLVETLYTFGYYSGVVRIALDGQEAAQVALLDVPQQIDTVRISVDPGQRFRFGRVAIGPAPEGVTVLPDLKAGDPARSSDLRDQALGTLDAWRDAGRPKATPISERVIADHNAATLDVELRIDPGPLVTFGDLVLTDPSAVKLQRIQRIAGLPVGETFSPAVMEAMATRLRRSGAFSSVAVTEAKELNPDDSVDVEVTLVDQKPRRFGFGGEVSSLEGLEVSGFWLHRNFLGGAERFRFDGQVSNIGGQSGGIDYRLGARLESPAYLGRDTNAFLLAEYENLNEPLFASQKVALGFGASRIHSDRVRAEAGLTWTWSETDDALGKRQFTLLTLPITGQMDRRDDTLAPTGGTYLGVALTPFVGLSGSTASGARVLLDGRGYVGLGAQDRVVLASRLQVGSVLGAGLRETQPEFLFTSGGGGTVRGQPFQSLDVDLGEGKSIGGRSFLGISTEARAKVNDRLGLVAFYDAGYVGAESLVDGSGAWHAGAGLGLRYDTGLGPIRLDVARPVGGTTGKGVQFYVGIGQAF